MSDWPEWAKALLVLLACFGFGRAGWDLRGWSDRRKARRDAHV